jgi:uncharacterized protein YciI
MEFTVIAYDGTDKGALERRMAVREAHLQVVASLREHMIHGGAILDDDGNMVGSIMITNFPDRAAFDAWFQNDPYITGNVWQDVTVVPFKTAPSFVGNIPTTESIRG